MQSIFASYNDGSLAVVVLLNVFFGVGSIVNNPLLVLDCRRRVLGFRRRATLSPADQVLDTFAEHLGELSEYIA